MLTNILRLLVARSIKPFIFNSSFKDKIEYDVENLGLYFHIPFCRNMCAFCPYYKVELNAGLLDKFIRALKDELLLISKSVGKKKKITTLYFGGGTPALAAEYLPGLMDMTRDLFTVKGDIGMELHPKDISTDLLEELKSCGVNMVSIGVQSFQDKCIASLGREKTDSIKKLQMADRAGFKTIDVDLIFGMPGQKAEDLEKDFEIAANFGASQISAYPFINFSYTKSEEKPIGERTKKIMLEKLIDAGENLGYRRSSIWTFARGGAPRYSSITRDNFIGLGPSATSLVGKIFKINTFSVQEYIKSMAEGKMPTALFCNLSERARALYWLFWSIYNLYIDEEDFLNLFKKRIERMFGLELYFCQKINLIVKCKGGYKLTAKGARLFHLIEQVYTHKYINKVWKIALKDPWPKKILLY